MSLVEGYRAKCLRINSCPILQAEEPEEDMDVRGGGQAAEERRIVKDGYESDDEEAKPFVNERIAGEIPSTVPPAVRALQ